MGRSLATPTDPAQVWLAFFKFARSSLAPSWQAIGGGPYPRFPVEFRGFPNLHAPFLNERRARGRVQEIRGISRFLRDVGGKYAVQGSYR
jgi:hypothetical protein